MVTVALLLDDVVNREDADGRRKETPFLKASSSSTERRGTHLVLIDIIFLSLWSDDQIDMILQLESSLLLFTLQRSKAYWNPLYCPSTASRAQTCDRSLDMISCVVIMIDLSVNCEV